MTKWSEMKPGVRNVFWLVAFLAAYAVTRRAVIAGRHAYSESQLPPLQRAMLRAIERRGATALFDSATSGLSDAQAKSAAVRLSAKGIARLSARNALTRATILDTLLHRADRTTCGQWTKGSSDPVIISRMLSSLTPLEMDAWADVSAAAMIAEVRQDPQAVEWGDSAAVELFRGILTDLNPPDEARYASAIQNAASLSDDEACWFGLTTYDRISGAATAVGERRAQLLAAYNADAVK